MSPCSRVVATASSAAVFPAALGPLRKVSEGPYSGLSGLELVQHGEASLAHG